MNQTPVFFLLNQMNLLLLLIKKDRSYASSRFRKVDEQNPDRLGIDAKVADRFDETIIAILMKIGRASCRERV